ncbi:E3 ubiquitin-protein ligase RNF25 isoform X2 [Cynara cardunculus var. scolymus]|uniref:E3 ubiquitin-protein ligase RNF25 isoform X2 n=1 Tax=Cynara cardunculus var. scolymus TaxID=59895 RepID=UPI000D62D086|nr:E3 ubiquitin-protein ligase RNF25 isoform X2 [Cynara cardunculus var. scolymus]
MAEEEVLIEVEAAESVYGDDCIVLEKYPPHLHLLIKPRTAEVSSQQYPDEPPAIVIIDSKGLDDQRQKHLITSVHNKACELSSNSMLIALCEEAMEKLTSMNHPDGDCPLCLSPLVEEGASDNASPFMKLMSCFHCFHCACIIRWWNWLQTHKEVDHASSSGPTAHPQQIKTQPGMHKNMEDGIGFCPVCRKVFHAKDIEHVLDLVGAYSQLNLDNTEGIENEMLLRLDSENTRRQKFEAILKLQQENNGLIEPKKTEVLMPGMFLPRPTTTIAANATSSDKESATGEQASESKTNAGVSSNSSNHRRSGPRSRYRGRNSRTQVDRRWIVKENGNAK